MPKVTRREFCGAAPLTLLGQSRKSARPNIIIFFVDELRATALKLYHPDGLETPNLARLASRSVQFNYAFTPHPLCMPARASLWTGQYSHTHGSRCNITQEVTPAYLRDDRQTMAEALHKAGYRTGIFGKNHCFTEAQLARWFDVDYSYPSNDPGVPGCLNKGLSPEDMALVQKNREWIRQQAGKPDIAPFPPEIFETHLANQRGMEFIEREAGKPFAAWISILAPHGPLEVPKEYAGVMSPERVKLPPQRDGEIKSKNTRMQIYDYVMRSSEQPESYYRQFLNIYDDMVGFIDHELGRLMALLEQKGLIENTIILFSADHGDFAAEHHQIYKCGSLVDAMVRIPFFVSWPGHLQEGHREDALVSQVDIMPTLLDWSGLDVPKSVEGQRLPFRPGDTRRSFVYSEYGAGEKEYTWEDARKAPQQRTAGKAGKAVPFKDTPLWQQLTRERSGHLRMIRTATHKFIRDSNGEIEFYDLVKDPNELDNAHARPEYRSLEQELDRKLT
jgi:arylsulfatase A-like enzyme